jgi:hypothetical protein
MRLMKGAAQWGLLLQKMKDRRYDPRRYGGRGALMLQSMRAIALVVAMLLGCGCGASFAELDRQDTANFRMGGCRSFIAGTQFRTGDDAFNVGVCAGIAVACLLSGCAGIIVQQRR